MAITEASGFGAAATPEQWSEFILEHLSHESVVLASGGTYIPTDNKQVHVPRITSDGTADWFDELEPIVTTDPQGDEAVLTPKKIAKLVTLSNESVGDSNESVLNAVGMACVRAVALGAVDGMLADVKRVEKRLLGYLAE